MKFSLALPITILLLLSVAMGGRVYSGEGLWSRFGSPTVSSDGVWTDWIIDGDWRIQRHATIGHVRLLDPLERRLAFGSMQQCYGELQRRRECGEVPPMPSHVVICLHGLRGSRNSLQGVSRYLTNHGGYRVVNFGYASTHGTVQQQAVALESVLRNLRGVQEVSLVAHSMGNILVRHLLYKLHVQSKPPPIEFRRMVMISPPNHGAALAGTLGQRAGMQLMLGEVIDQFDPSRDWKQLEQQLSTPEFEFGIIAGGRGNDTGYLVRIAGDDDGLLSIATHKLDGTDGFLQIGGLHQSMPQFGEVQAATLRFLQSGSF